MVFWGVIKYRLATFNRIETMFLLKYFIQAKNRVKVLAYSKKHRKFSKMFYKKKRRISI